MIKSYIKAKVVSSITFGSFEYQKFILKFKVESVRLVVRYRPPNVNDSSISDFYDVFGDYLSWVSSCPELPLVLGDFNIHVDDLKSPHRVSFNSLLNIHHITQKVVLLHMTEITVYLMLVIEDDDIVQHPRPLYPDLSDHNAIYSKMFIAKPDPITIKCQVRNLKDIDNFKFSQDVALLHLDSPSTDDLPKHNNSSLTAVLESHAPVSEKKQ